MVIQSSVEKTTNVIQQSFAFFFASVNSLFGFTSPCIELILYVFFNIHINLFVDKQTFIYIHIFIYLHNIYIYTFISICSHSFLNGDGTFLTGRFSFAQGGELFGREFWPSEIVAFGIAGSFRSRVPWKRSSFQPLVEFPGSQLG